MKNCFFLSTYFSFLHNTSVSISFYTVVIINTKYWGGRDMRQVAKALGYISLSYEKFSKLFTRLQTFLLQIIKSMR